MIPISTHTGEYQKIILLVLERGFVLRTFMIHRMEDEDISQPVSESYAYVSQDSDISLDIGLTDDSLLQLAMKIDNYSHEHVPDVPDVPENQIRAQTAEPQETADETEDEIEDSVVVEDVKVSVDELNNILKPMLNSNFKDIKETLQQFIKQKPHDLSSANSTTDLNKKLYGLSLNGSPLTTPPTSKEEDKEIQQLKQEIMALRSENQQLSETRRKNAELSMKLEQSRSFNKEILNEVNYYKNNSALLGDVKKLLTEDTIDRKFRFLYSDLHLDNVDKLTRVEMSNFIKQILLKLLIDYNNVPQNISTLAEMFKRLVEFANNVHKRLYLNEANGVNFDYNDPNALVDLSICLNDMMNKV